MKKLFAVLVFVLLCISVCAQKNKNSIRIAGGISIAPNTVLEDNYALRIGPSISIAYTRCFNKYISGEAELYSSFVNRNNTASNIYFDFAVKAAVTPLADFFRHLELGAGLAVRYDQFMLPIGERSIEDKTIINTGYTHDWRDVWLGINYFIRLYAIRNDRFDLFAFYEPRTNFTHNFDTYYWATSNAGVAFGVKF